MLEEQKNQTGGRVAKATPQTTPQSWLLWGSNFTAISRATTAGTTTDPDQEHETPPSWTSSRVSLGGRTQNFRGQGGWECTQYLFLWGKDVFPHAKVIKWRTIQTRTGIPMLNAHHESYASWLEVSSVCCRLSYFYLQLRDNF